MKYEQGFEETPLGPFCSWWFHICQIYFPNMRVFQNFLFKIISTEY